MVDTPIDSPAAATLAVTAALVEEHHRHEWDLFELCGAWSAAGDRSAARGFFATQSALHAWRAEQWLCRMPRSVEPEIALRSGPKMAGWTRAIAASRGIEEDVPRLIAWCGVLLGASTAALRSHQKRLSVAADDGTARLLQLFLDDLARQWAEGQELLAGLASAGDLAASMEGLSSVLTPLWSG